VKNISLIHSLLINGLLKITFSTTSPFLEAGTAVQTMLFESLSLFDKAMFTVVLGTTVAQVLRYKSEGRWFDPR
jgi:hypothetical protein